MSVSGSQTITVDASPAAVWAWVGNLETHGEWSPKAYQIERVSGEAGAVGSRYRSTGWVPGDKKHVNEVEIVESVPDERLVLRAEDELGAFTNTYTLRSSGAGTEVTFHLAFPELKAPERFLVPVLFPLVGKADMRKRLKLLKECVEARSA